ncbi:MAG TPA: DciA family protein, partial [Elusimicrobiota bacterium]|nr:DciA family protein [Elusimicrobiota bacterium]
NYAVFEIWDRLLGVQATRAKAVGLQGRRLCVEVDSSARLHDLMLRKRTLLRKLNEHFGTRPVISDIILQLAQNPSVRRTMTFREKSGTRRPVHKKDPR